MSNRTVEDIVNVLSRNTIDGSAVEKTLISASVKNFHTLYDIQRDLIGFQRYDVPIQELERVYKINDYENKQHYPHRYVYRIPRSIISSNSRRACKEAGYYGMAIPQELISTEIKIFDFNFLIFIDGHMIDTGEIIIHDNSTIFVLDVSAGESTNFTDGIPMEDYLNYYENNSVVTFLVLPNYRFATSTFNKYTYNDVMNHRIHYNRFSGDVSVFDDTRTLFFMNNNSDASTKDGFICVVDSDNSFVYPSEDVIMDDGKLSIMAITLSDVYEVKTFHPGDSLFFQLDDSYESVLPVENIMTFTGIGNGRYIFNNQVGLKLYYPNIYEITGWDEQQDLVMYIMYRETNDAQYHNELSMLKILSGKLVDRYENKSLPEEVYDYQPIDNQWLSSSNEFKSSIYFPNKALYNIDALSDIVIRDPYFLVQYAYLKMKGSNKYYINVSKLSLEGRERNDTYLECQDTGDIVYFDEPHYLFSLPQKFTGPHTLDFRMFIDNGFINPFEYTFIIAADYFHFYIPCTLVKANSIIELDKFDEYDFTRFTTFSSVDDKVVIELPKHIKRIYAQDINVVDETTKAFLPISYYKIIAYSDIMEEDIELQPDGYASITKSFTMKLTNDVYVGQRLRIFVNHRLISTSIRAEDITEDDVPVTVNLVTNSRLNSSKVRVYSARQMLPSTTYSMSHTGRYLGKSKLALFLDVTANPNAYKGVTVDQIPIGQKCEFYLDLVDNMYGFVDTGNALTLPLDLRWYDIYVNGLKLNKSNVDIITSSKFFIKNVNSRHNLYIYARGDVYDEFSILHNETEDNILFNRIDEIYEELLKNRSIIEDTMEDIISDLLINIAKHYKFVSEILEYSFINANEQQVTEEIRTLFPEMIDDNGILWLDTNTCPSAGYVSMIDSNVRGDYMKHDQYRYGWSPLYIGSHDDAKSGEYLCDPITGAPGMKNSDGSVIASGELDRLSIHKNNFQNSLSYMNLSYLDVYQVQFDENTASRNIVDGQNVLDETIDVNDGIMKKKMVLSLDVQVLKKGYKDVMTYSECVPTVSIIYSTAEGLTLTEDNIPLNMLPDHCINFSSTASVHIRSIKINVPDPDVKCILHSILLAI